jgi:beta-phosphoglucomutase family hydrolase
MLGLPNNPRACLFDLDGVLTDTATLHVAAWQETFDAFLATRARHAETAIRPFDPVADYRTYVDGRPRIEGTREFLRSRGIELPEGRPDDDADTVSIWGLSNRKNKLVLTLIERHGVAVFPGSLRYLRAVRAAGLKTAVVSSSANTRRVLEVTGLAPLLDHRVDGVTARQRRLAGKPAPAMFVAAAADLGIPPERAAVFEDALVGVEAGRAGGFGTVVGVDRLGQADALRAHGADIVVSDLGDLLGEPA